MIPASVIDRLRRGRAAGSPDGLQPAQVAPLPEASMRLLEIAIACAALAAAVLLGLAR